jgi:chromate transporter
LVSLAGCKAQFGFESDGLRNLVVSRVSALRDHNPAGVPAHGVSLQEAFWVWLRVGLLSLGGPAGQIAVMHRIVVEERRWISEARFRHALDYCMLLPGAEAQKLATYLGWLMHRTIGGVMAGSLFVVPGVVFLMGLTCLYAAWGKEPIVVALFHGLKSAVLVIVLGSVIRTGRCALNNSIMVALAAVALIATFFFRTPFPLIIFAAAVIGTIASMNGLITTQSRIDIESEDGGIGNTASTDSLIGDKLPEDAHPTVMRALGISVVCFVLWLMPIDVIVAKLGETNAFSQIAVFFSGVALVSFGDPYAVIAFVAQTMDSAGVLKPGEMLDGLGMIELTPAPLIMALQYVGFMAAYRHPGSLSPMVAGALGGVLTTWVTLIPCFVWVFLGAPFIETLRSNKTLGAALSAVAAAAVGVVLSLAIWFAIHTAFREAVPIRAFPLVFDAPRLSSIDLWTLALSAAAAIAIFGFRVGTIPTLVASGAAGMIMFLVGIIP